MDNSTVSQKSHHKSIGDYTIIKTLGKGTFGKVKLAIHNPSQQYVAIKILLKSKILENNDIQRISRQIHILKKIRHPNIVQLYQIIQTPQYIFLVMEYCPNGQLIHQINQKRLTQEQASRYFFQMLDAIDHLHLNNIIHRDLKPQNMLLDQFMNIKIIDYGLSNTYQKNQLLSTPCGSPCYACPEMIAGRKYYPQKVDVWSLGVILYALLTGSLPFDEQNNDRLYYKILYCDYFIPQFLSEQAQQLIKSIFVKQSQRVSIKEIKQSKFYKKYHKNNSKNNKQQNTLRGNSLSSLQIPFNQQVFSKQKFKGYNIQLIKLAVKANKHNQVSTNYYLNLKKKIRQGSLDKNENWQHQMKDSKQLSKINQIKNQTKYSDKKICEQINILKKQHSDITHNLKKEARLNKVKQSFDIFGKFNISKSEELKPISYEKRKCFPKLKQTQQLNRYMNPEQNHELDLKKIKQQIHYLQMNKIDKQMRSVYYKRLKIKVKKQQNFKLKLKVNQVYRPLFKIKNYQFSSIQKKSQLRKSFQKNNTYVLYDRGMFNSMNLK